MMKRGRFVQFLALGLGFIVSTVNYSSLRGGEAPSGPIESGFDGFVSKLDFSGLLHPQFDYLESNLVGTDAAGPVKRDTVFVRRLQFGVKGAFTEELKFEFLTDIAGKKVEDQRVRLEWDASTQDVLYLSYEKAPFGHEDTISSSKVKPIERSVSTRFWNEVIGVGSYHTGLYYARKLGSGYTLSLGVANNSSGEEDFGDSDLSLYARVQKKSDNSLFGVDIAHQSGDEKTEKVNAASVYGDYDLSGYVLSAELMLGEIEDGGEIADATSWHLQMARMLGKKLELVTRIAGLDTDGFGAKLSSTIRKAPFSGFLYDDVESFYWGLNYYLVGNELKLSLGYEYGEGSHPVNAGESGIKERISGFRARGQLKF